MIIVRLAGGLGNQMFQYAAGFAAALRNSDTLKLDIQEYRKYKLHSYSLYNFSITAKIASKKETDLIAYKKHSVPDRIIRKILRRGREKSKNYIAEKSFAFDRSVLELRGDLYLDGYWQSEKYFNDIQKELRKEFSLRSEMNPASTEMKKKIQDCNSVSIHIRRGDYFSDKTSNSIHGVDLEAYYQSAINYILSKTEDPHFFIFSDDPMWVKANFMKNIKCTVVDCNPPSSGYFDMFLMSACRHNITANSSFSWWGAWLNPDESKIVVAPSKWFRDGSVDTSDIYCSDWIRI